MTTDLLRPASQPVNAMQRAILKRDYQYTDAMIDALGTQEAAQAEIKARETGEFFTSNPANFEKTRILNSVTYARKLESRKGGRG